MTILSGEMRSDSVVQKLERVKPWRNAKIRSVEELSAASKAIGANYFFFFTLKNEVEICTTGLLIF